MSPEILNEKIVWIRGLHITRQRWLKGVHPDLGTIIWGLTGWETVVVFDSVVPSRVVQVAERDFCV